MSLDQILNWQNVLNLRSWENFIFSKNSATIRGSQIQVVQNPLQKEPIRFLLFSELRYQTTVYRGVLMIILKQTHHWSHWVNCLLQDEAEQSKTYPLIFLISASISTLEKFKKWKLHQGGFLFWGFYTSRSWGMQNFVLITYVIKEIRKYIKNREFS